MFVNVIMLKYVEVRFYLHLQAYIFLLTNYLVPLRCCTVMFKTLHPIPGPEQMRPFSGPGIKPGSSCL